VAPHRQAHRRNHLQQKHPEVEELRHEEDEEVPEENKCDLKTALGLLARPRAQRPLLPPPLPLHKPARSPPLR